jgi:hypothetical protein
MLLLASFPKVVRRLRISEFYFKPPFSVIMIDLEVLIGELLTEDPSGIAEKTD